MSRRFLSLIFFLALVGCAGAAPASAQGGRDEIAGEEYAVYSSVVTEISARERQQAALIWDHTVARGVPASAQRDETVAELIEDFNRQNARPYPLGNGLKPARPYRLINEESLKGMESLPSPIITLSRVGFNGAKDRALVYVSYGRGVSFRREHFVVLKKGEDGWKVERKLAVFIPSRPV